MVRSHVIPLTAVGALVYGLALMAAPNALAGKSPDLMRARTVCTAIESDRPHVVEGVEGDYNSTTYVVAFRLMSHVTWGALFFAVGLATLAYPRPSTVGCLAATLAAWSVALTSAVVQGTAGTIADPVWLVLASVNLLLSIKRHGTGL